MTAAKKEKTFEEAFARLEEILEKMSGDSIALDTSLKLYEEADSLILFCGKRLQSAEQTIETLIKNRNGELKLNEDQTPATEPFASHE